MPVRTDRGKFAAQPVSTGAKHDATNRSRMCATDLVVLQQPRSFLDYYKVILIRQR